MKPDSPFERLVPLQGAGLAFTLDGEPMQAAPGETLAAALLAAGVLRFRASAVSGAPRGPFCMMGACFECLVEVDGEAVQACMSEVREGMRVRRIQGARRITDE